MSNSHKKRNLAPDTLEAAAAAVMRTAVASGTPVALAGGLALQLYGSTRLTGDVGFVAERAMPEYPPERRLSFGGYASNVGGVPLDLILRDDDFEPLYQEALRDAMPHPTLPGAVIRPEFLVAMKMVAGRKRDEADLEFLLTEADLDVASTRQIVYRFLGPYAAREFDQALQIARWRAER